MENFHVHQEELCSWKKLNDTTTSNCETKKKKRQALSQGGKVEDFHNYLRKSQLMFIPAILTSF